MRRWVGVKGSTRNERHDPKCPFARLLRIVREDTSVPSEGANCAWMAEDKAVGCTRAFLTTWWFSRRQSLVYADKPQTLDHLEDNIPRVIADIRPKMLEKVIENWTSRLDYIRASRGSPMPEIIFKM
ncbi:uncharacterized protein TNCV_3656191 [Trichonephila clavipes]|nr:uncharacterized protein TNCV_3656191 [Trichonephila clavipes]